VILVAIPLVFWQLGRDDKSSFWVVLFYVCSTIIGMMTSMPSFLFLLAASVDLRRRLQISQALGELVKTTSLDTSIAFSIRSQPVQTRTASVTPLSTAATKRRRASVTLAALTSTHRAVKARRSQIDLSSTAGSGMMPAENTSGGCEGSQPMSRGGPRRETDEDVEERLSVVSPADAVMSKKNEDEDSDGHSPAASGLAFSSYVDTVVPRIYSNMTSNVEAWGTCRIVMGDFGARFKYRVDLYLGTLIYYVNFTSNIVE
jgi:hypothetical protein